MESGEYINCSESDCTEKIKNNYWAKVKSNWFQQRDGKAYCPKHTPAWVDDWRKRNDR